MTESKNLEGLGGWLILVGIGIIISPLRIITQFGPMYFGIFSDGTFTALTTPGTEVYHELYAPFIYGEILANCIVCLAFFFIAFLFFSKKKKFKAWYIATILFSSAFIIIDSYAFKLINPTEPIFDPATLKEFSRSLIGVFIWIPYVLMSKRVKATFVK